MKKALTAKDSQNASGGPPEIRRLPDDLVDQIAAGEVVERPASIVKELVENALDARATRIRVEVRAGGTALIAIEDNGVGMDPEQLRLAVQRHATSKIRGPEDLVRIGSYGFRGEALPAIASVSAMRIVTRPHGSDIGHEIRIEASQIEMDRAVGCPVGTRIEVADLFARIPARRKFLKQPTTEWGHAIDWLGRLAMALPSVHFDIQRDDRKAMVWPSTQDPIERVARVLGESQANALTRIDWEEGTGHIEAYISGPEHSRANANAIHLYVNGRPVRDKLLRSAVMTVYRDLLPRGRFPLAVLFLTVDPERVDVNVHPAKWEVRFRDPQAIHQLIRNALRSGIEKRDYLAPSSAPSPASVDRWTGHGHHTPTAAAHRHQAPGLQTGPQEGDWLFADRGSTTETESWENRTPVQAENATTEEGRVDFSSQKLLGQLMARYLVLEGEGALLLVDQHAAHERIVYEKLRQDWVDGGVARQGLLIPVTVDLEPQALSSLVRSQEVVEQLGFELEAFGEDSVVVRAVPEILVGSNPEDLVRDLADELNLDLETSRLEPTHTRLLSSVDRFFATAACHSARRFGDHLPEEEQKSILAGLDAIPWAPTCPHGRPVVARFDVRELDGLFGRK